MDFLKAEIARKRKITEEIRQNIGNDNTNSVNVHLKYVCQRDIMDADAKARIEAQKKFDEAEAQKKKIKIEKNFNEISYDCNQSNGQSSTNTPSATSSAISAMNNNSFLTKQLQTLSVADVKKRLRSLSEPITLFNESDQERIDRLIQLINTQIDANFENVSDSKALEDDAMLYKIENSKDMESDSEDETNSNQPSNTATDSNKKHTKDPLWFLDKNIKYHEVKGYSDGKVVFKYFKSLLKHWEYILMNRDERVKTTAKGKLEMQTLKRCKEYLKPFFRMCLSKSKEGLPETLPNIYAMVVACEQHNFVLANDWYIKTAIGNAAWPIGVTMVGIHERSNREKITKVAHVMNNEFQRKYLTSLKQLMTFAQDHVDIAPSMKVM